MIKSNPIPATISELTIRRDKLAAQVDTINALIRDLSAFNGDPAPPTIAPPTKATLTTVPRRKYTRRAMTPATVEAIATGKSLIEPKQRGPYKPRQPGLQPLDITAPKKPGRKPKLVQTPEQAAETVKVILNGDGTPGTFAGACKRVMREASHALTVVEIFTAVESRWPALCAEKDAGNVAANLSYQAAQGKCEKIGMGNMATWRILDAEFYKETES